MDAKEILLNLSKNKTFTEEQYFLARHISSIFAQTYQYGKREGTSGGNQGFKKSNKTQMVFEMFSWDDEVLKTLERKKITVARRQLLDKKDHRMVCYFFFQKPFLDLMVRFDLNIDFRRMLDLRISPVHRIIIN